MAPTVLVFHEARPVQNNELAKWKQNKKINESQIKEGLTSRSIGLPEKRLVFVNLSRL